MPNQKTNKFPYFTEDQIRQTSESPGLAMLGLWHEVCEAKIGERHRVIMIDRYEYHDTKDVPGKYSTAGPLILDDGEGVLALIVELTDGIVPEVLWTHELGHWILFMEDFRSVIVEGTRDGGPIDRKKFQQGALNSLAHHPPLCELQQSFGLDTVMYFDERATYHLDILKGGKYLVGDLLVHCLLAADDLMQCSVALREEYERALESHDSQTLMVVNTILGTAREFDLMNPYGNMKFLRRLIVNLGIQDEWIYAENDPAALRSAFGSTET